jgi:hypothetical protein
VVRHLGLVWVVWPEEAGRGGGVYGTVIEGKQDAGHQGMTRATDATTMPVPTTTPARTAFGRSTTR